MAAAPLDRVKALLAALPRQDQENLTRFLHDILGTPEAVAAKSRHVATLQTRGKRGKKSQTYTFRNEWIRCGKDTCRCAAGAFHGPYTYKYWREDGRVKKAYVGKTSGDDKDATRTTRPAGKGRANRARGNTARNNSGPTPPA